MKGKNISLVRTLNRRFTLPFERKLLFAVRSFSKKERGIFFLLAAVFITSAAGLLWNVNQSFLVDIPSDGGWLVEGVVGAPRFINPLLAISDADRDLTALIYSGLMRRAEDGTLKNDLAESYSVSANGLTYTFTLRDNIFWHNGEPITSDDVVFTIERARNSVLKSPRRASWDGITVKKISEREMAFVLSQPYAPFLENTTMGILPRHIWKDIPPEQFGFSKYNIESVGSGPYKIKKIKKDAAGIPEYYDLVPFKKFALNKPYISNVRIRFYSNIDKLLEAFEAGEVGAINSISPEAAERLTSGGYRVENSPLPRVFGVFFNQSQAKIFTDKAVRKALGMTIDKEKIVSEVLHGYATTIDAPIPPGSIGYIQKNNVGNESISMEEKRREALEILERNGWKFDEEEGVMTKKTKEETLTLEFSLSTSEIPELKGVVNILKESWEKLGARVQVKIFETGNLNQNVIRPRKYDALFFGEIVGRDSDLFAFWHSSQRLDPGLNIALYANITADKLLEEARTITDTRERIKKYEEFQKEVAADIPALFLYSPDFIYAIPQKIKGLDLEGATIPSERFLNIHTWYIETDRVWKIFVNN